MAGEWLWTRSLRRAIAAASAVNGSARAAVAIATNQWCDDVLEQGVVSFLRRQNPRAPFGQPGFEQIAGDRIRQRVADPAEQPVVIEQHQVDADVGIARDLEPGIQVRKELLVESGRKAPVVVRDSRAAVAEHKPARDDEAETGHVIEVARDRVAPCRDAEVRSPHVGTEVQPVEDRLPVGGPGIVHAVNKWFAGRHGSRVRRWRA
jgi:hypothetical protein